MKRKILKFASIVMLLIAGTVMSACESKDTIRVILPETVADKNITDFFSMALPVTAVSVCFFTATDNDTCCIINSIYELNKICACPNDLPEIDFIRYSLIIGKKIMPNSFYTVLEQKIIEEPSSLKLIVKLNSGDHWNTCSTLYHWGLYQKLSNSQKLNVEYLF